MVVHAHINTVPHGSTGRIMMAEHRRLLAGGEDSFAFWGRGRDAESDSEMKFSSDLDIALDAIATRLDGKSGFHSVAATRRLLARLDQIDPDVVHLHNLHGYYLNIQMLFEWLHRHHCRVEWTLHDCWAFTGHCAYFSFARCDQWESCCAYSGNCPQLAAYPRTIAGSSTCMWCFKQKKAIFNMLEPDRMKLITPSRWLSDLVGRSFLFRYPVQVIPNTVDTSVFKPMESSVRDELGVGNRYMILGVASPWSERKGLPDFYTLANRIDPASAVIVLVGVSRKQRKSLLPHMIGLSKTDSQVELAELYSAADVFFNPTYEDNYPTVNLEAEACGTPVITYDTGGSPETITLSDSRVVANVDEAVDLLSRLCLR